MKIAQLIKTTAKKSMNSSSLSKPGAYITRYNSNCEQFSLGFGRVILVVANVTASLTAKILFIFKLAFLTPTDAAINQTSCRL